MGDELSELGKAAVWYCEHGFAIIPLGTSGESRKHPISKHGLNDWFDNPEDARKLWTQRPNLNIGIVCGTPSHGLVVIDVDVDEEKDKDGYATLSEWERTYGELPETAIAVTGSGGMHYLYRTDRTTIRPSANKLLGIDIRADGSYIVAPPSVHPNGRRYEWQDNPEDVPILTATHSVYDFIDYVQRNGGETDETKKENGKFQLPDRIGKGSRDNILFKYASHLRAIGRSDAEILNTVMGANFTRCDPPLDSKDVQRVCKSACRYERGEHGSDERAVGRPGGGGGDMSDFRTPRGRIRTNVLGAAIIERNFACKIDGALAVWTGKKWAFGKRAVNRVALEYADDINKQERAEVYSYIDEKAEDVSSDKHFDGRHYVQFRNCTWDVLANEAVEPTHEMLITNTLPIDLDTDAPYGQADLFIESLAGGDAYTETVLKEIVGACMCCRRVISQSPMLIGRAHGSTASNGKSTYLNVLRSLLGTGNVSSLDIATLGQRFQAGRIMGKLANLGDDIPDGFLRGDELSLFKKLVTGDAIYTDVKNAEGFEFRPSATLVFSMNAMPRLADTTDGVFRRLAFVPFRNHFAPGEEGYDPDIVAKMTDERNLMRLAVLGLMELPQLIKRGALTPIPDMVAEVEAVKIDNDVVRRWLFDLCLEDNDIEGRWVSDVYADFKRWCDENGEKYGASQMLFTKRVLATLATLTAKNSRDRALGKNGRKFFWANKDEKEG